MTSKERISNILKHKPVDRVGISESFWGDTHKEYYNKGFVGEHESLEDHFDLDIVKCFPLNLVLDLNFTPKVVAEDEDTITMLDANGAYLRRHKKHDTTPEHIDFSIKCKDDFQKYRHHLLENFEKRINFEGYRVAKEKAKKNNKFFCCGSTNVFECMHPICGHEHMLVGMALEPEWISDMADLYSQLIVDLQTILFEKEGYPDGIYFFEDMGYKGTPFMSPTMYCELIQPAHIKTINFAHKNNLPVIMHSCGFIEPLLPYMIEAGIDCLEVIEVKAGMDLLRIHKNFGGKIALMGGIDVRVLYTNDKALIDAELEAKIPIVKNGYGFIAHSDHSIPRTVNYETFVYYLKKVKELGSY